VNNTTMLPTAQKIAPEIMDAVLCMQGVQKLASPAGTSFIYTNGTQIQSFDEIQNNITTAGNLPYTFASDNQGAYATVKGVKYFGDQLMFQQLCVYRNIRNRFKIYIQPRIHNLPLV
jgi:hypothetical protein